MKKAEQADTLKERIIKLIENITYQTFIYTSRGLFERDKLIFICQMTIQVHNNYLYIYIYRYRLYKIIVYTQIKYFFILDPTSSTKNKIIRVRIFIEKAYNTWLKLSIRLYFV